MTEDGGRWLLTSEGRALTEVAAALRVARTPLPRALEALRKRSSPEQAAAAWELAELRNRAEVKFGADAAHLFFVREALEQASARRAAAYHAECFRHAGIKTVTDVCGGIGGDAIAFARLGLKVTVFERDPLRALFAAANMEALGVQELVRVVPEPMTTEAVPDEAIWFDPARRGAQGRAMNPEQYEPPLSTLEQWAGRSVGVKLAPAIPHALAKPYDADLEFVSDGGECKEALLWSGTLRTGFTLRATLLRDTEVVPLEVNPALTPALAGPTEGNILYEPDPAVIRAGGVGTLAQHLGARLVAPQIAYLLSIGYRETPFATAYSVLERFPYSARRLQKILTQRAIGKVVIKKRGFPREPEDVRRELRLRGTEEITVVLTRAAVGPGYQVILCRPMSETG